MKKGTTIVGLIEPVILKSHSGRGKKIFAKIDTGAQRSSIDMRLASFLDLGETVKRVKVTSAHGKTKRAVKKAKIIIKGRTINASFNIADRSHMKYKALIGRNILKLNFLVDVSMKR